MDPIAPETSEPKQIPTAPLLPSEPETIKTPEVPADVPSTEVLSSADVVPPVADSLAEPTAPPGTDPAPVLPIVPTLPGKPSRTFPKLKIFILALVLINLAVGAQTVTNARLRPLL